MRVKKDKKPARSIRYLLHVDRTLRRISLRRMSVRVKKGTKGRRPARSKHSPRGKNGTRLGWAASPWVVTGAICLTGAVALISARGPSHQERVSRVDASPAMTAPPPSVVATPARVDTGVIVQTKMPPAADAGRMHTVASPVKKTSDIRSEEPPIVQTAAIVPVAERVPASAKRPSDADVQTVASVAISGCLERDDEAFWLKDTSGAEAPKSRSWKSGFLKKRSVPVELVDAKGTLKLDRYVGQRVTATGTLANREMRPHSLQRVAVSCS